MKKLGVVLLATMALGLAGCASPGGTSYFDDAGTTVRVKRAIYDDPSLKVMDISVTTVDGVVELSGKVKSRGQGVKAVQVARKVEGVKRVNNQLAVEK
ncbi:MAG TPA: BON domain-containing protein [Burkholderiales bacterium]|jgi:osmotically-inducible protein OsmY